MNRYEKPRSPRGLLVLIGVAVLVGVASLVVSYVNYQVGTTASNEQVDRNARLTIEVQRQGYETCKAIERVAVQVHLRPPRCTPPSTFEP